MAISLSDAERLTVEVSFDDGNGHVTPLGRSFDGHFTPATIAHFVNDPDGTTVWIEALAVGTGTVTIERQDHTLSQVFDITVTDSGTPPPPEPGTPHLVITFGTPEPK
jgi:hypothetical protein